MFLPLIFYELSAINDICINIFRALPSQDSRKCMQLALKGAIIDDDVVPYSIRHSKMFRIDYTRSALTMYPMYGVFCSFTKYEVSIHLIQLWGNPLVIVFPYISHSFYANCFESL